MTDDEIIKALECCSNDDDGSGCGNCPLGDQYPYCDDVLDGQIIDLINRQKAEIERLKGWENLLKAEKYTPIKSKAVKEFAERLKANITINNTNDGYLDYAVDYNCLMEDIDDLVEKMAGKLMCPVVAEMHSCETCVHYDSDRDDQPCGGCCGGVNWEKGEVDPRCEE